MKQESFDAVMSLPAMCLAGGMRWLLLFSVCLTVQTALAAEKGDPVAIPDFTQGETLGREANYDWTLGPTGARGMIYSAHGHTQQARQILVTSVAPTSPADGQLEQGDVLLGIDDKPFTADARVQLANAITTAETDVGAGRLRLLRWRKGVSQTVELKLPVLGSYSDTAPYDCPKSRRILEQGCASLARRMAASDYTRQLDAIPRSLNALALLASGQPDYLPLVEREAQWAAKFRTDGFLSWYYGYILTFLSEYIVATGDRSVMPGLERIALETARGQSRVGTWGHRFAAASGNLEGYGCMNQPGLSLTIGMVLAREAGVQQPEVDHAIEKSADFLRWYIYKGAIPYGDHQPFPAHEDNGKCAAGTVLFDLLGDREASEFFARMTTAAYSERERGHTGNYFNYLWALLGVARCGPTASGAYLKEQAWYYDLARDWESKFVYQYSPVGAEEYRAYTRWDCSGSHLLAYALPLQRLRLTGKKPFTVRPLDAAQVADVIAAGRDFAYRRDENPYERRTTEQLLAGLASWSPFVRMRSAAALGKRDGDLVPKILTLLASDNRDARYGACEALGALGARGDAAAPQLRAALQDGDPWLQSLAAEAIRSLSPPERKASVSDLLAVIVRTNPNDPRRHAALYASTVLFDRYPGTRAPQSILEASLEGIDRKQLYPAIHALLGHPDSIARGSVAKTFRNLDDHDLVELLPDIVNAIKPLAPSNEMFADGVRLAGLDLLSRLHIREGMALCVSVLEPERWGERNRSRAILPFLERYGAHAQSQLPQVKAAREYLAKVKRVPADQLTHFDRAIVAIESSSQKPTLVNLSEFKSRPGSAR